MFTHVMVGTNDMQAAAKFYDAVLGTLGLKPFEMPNRPVRAYPGDGVSFTVCEPRNTQPATANNGGTIGFKAESAEQVDAFHAAGLANGGTDAGEPGPRPNAPGNAYGAYLRDPDGHKICAFTQLKT